MSTRPKYVFGKVTPGPKACRVDGVQNVEDVFEFMDGVSRHVGFPQDALFRMNDAFPLNLQLEDFISNLNNLLVVSVKTRELVEQIGSKNNEFLPVAIVNHKGRREKAPYVILHQIELQDCIDIGNSQFTRNAIDPERFMVMKRIAIDERRVDADVLLFRMARFPTIPVFRRDLADAIIAQGCSGIRMVEIANWGA